MKHLFIVIIVPFTIVFFLTIIHLQIFLEKANVENACLNFGR